MSNGSWSRQLKGRWKINYIFHPKAKKMHGKKTRPRKTWMKGNEGVQNQNLGLWSQRQKENQGWNQRAKGTVCYKNMKNLTMPLVMHDVMLQKYRPTFITEDVVLGLTLAMKGDKGSTMQWTWRNTPWLEEEIFMWIWIFYLHFDCFV